MAETAVSFVLEQLSSVLKEKASLLCGVPTEFAKISQELQSIHAFLKDADRKAKERRSEGIEAWVEQLTQAVFRIEDVIDEYKIFMAQQPQGHDWLTLLHEILYVVKTAWHRLRIASEIKEIKSSVVEIAERSRRYRFESSIEGGSTRSGGTENVNWDNPQMASLFIKESEVVGFEEPKDALLNWLVKGSAEREVISVVGMGGLGKTTLAKTVFDSQEVTSHFDCQAFITVSQSYSVERLLREMMAQFCKSRKEPLPEGMNTTNQVSLINEARDYLRDKRYVVFFDDVWKLDFWSDVRLFVPDDNNNGSRVLITTQWLDVAEFCMRSSPVHVHHLQPLSFKKAWKLFRDKAFRFESSKKCPEELFNVAVKIVDKCECLPLAIVTIGAVLSTKEKTISVWQTFYRTLSLELQSNLSRLTGILDMTYNDLPYHLQYCLLYLGIYPEDYSINCVRLARQWVAEGFVKYEEGKTLEEVAEEYLTELIHRSLVQVSEINFDRKVRRVRVHDLLREIIITKMKKLSFCHFVSEDDQSISNQMITRRLAIATSSDDVLRSIGHLSSIRSLYFFEIDEVSESFVGNILAKFKLLKVLDFEDAPLGCVPDNLENLFHLRYLCLRNTNVHHLPKSIGKLQNLETLDLKQTCIREIPSEINNLTKLRHLLVYYRDYKIEFSLTRETETLLEGSIGCLTSLQKLCHVVIHEDGLHLINELKRLRHLKKLGLKHVKREYGQALCESIMVMKHLESLNIYAIAEDEMIDLNFITSPPPLRRLYLNGRLDKFPLWVSQLQHLVRLAINYSRLKDDPLESLRKLPNLLSLSIGVDAFDGESMHFKEGEFEKLEKLYIIELKRLNSIHIEQKALPVLNDLYFVKCPELKVVPFGIHNLERVELLRFIDMPREFIEIVDGCEGQGCWVIEHVPLVIIGQKVGPGYDNYEFRTIRHPDKGKSTIRHPDKGKSIML